MIYKNFLLPASLSGAHDNDLRVYVQYFENNEIFNISFHDFDNAVQPVITFYPNNFFLIDPFILDYIKNYHLIEILKNNCKR
jgi:hypothetical protein